MAGLAIGAAIAAVAPAARNWRLFIDILLALPAACVRRAGAVVESRGWLAALSCPRQTRRRTTVPRLPVRPASLPVGQHGFQAITFAITSFSPASSRSS